MAPAIIVPVSVPEGSITRASVAASRPRDGMQENPAGHDPGSGLPCLPRRLSHVPPRPPITPPKKRRKEISEVPASDAFVPAKQKYLKSLDHDIDGLASFIAAGEDLLAGVIDEVNDALDRYRMESGKSDLAFRVGDEISARLI